VGDTVLAMAKPRPLLPDAAGADGAADAGTD
jgi:hypothetical protein